MECPPAPIYRFMQPLLLGVADGDNYCISDLQQPSRRLRSRARRSRAGFTAGLFFSRDPCHTRCDTIYDGRYMRGALHWMGRECCYAVTRVRASRLCPTHALERDGRISPMMGAL